MKFNEKSGEDVKPVCITKEARDTCPVKVVFLGERQNEMSL